MWNSESTSLYLICNRTQRCKCHRCDTIPKKIRLIYEVGIVNAFVAEDVIIQEFEPQFQPIGIAGWRFNRGILRGKLVVNVVSGIGMTNSAAVTQLLITIFNPVRIFFLGLAGNMNEDHQIGDVIINQRWADIAHQKYIRSSRDSCRNITDTFFDTEIDFPNRFFRIQGNNVVSFTRPDCVGCNNPNVTPGDNKIRVLSDPSLITTKLAIPMEIETFTDPEDAYQETPPSQFFFHVDKNLFRIAHKVVKNLPRLSGRICINHPDCDQIRRGVAKIGDLGLSAGSTFLDNNEYRRDVIRTFGTFGIQVETIDMETVAFAQVAISNKVPFLAIRGLSDLAGGPITFDTIRGNIVAIDKNILEVLLAILAKIPNINPTCHCE